MSSNITTKTGDYGQTDFAGFRLDKDEVPIRLMCSIDQLNSFMGTARAQTEHQLVWDLLHKLQLDAFILAGEIATAQQNKASLKNRIDRKFIWDFEKRHESLSDYKDYPDNFVVPGGHGSVVGGMIDICRTIARKIEGEFSEFCNTVIEDDEGEASWPKLVWPDIHKTSNEDDTWYNKVEFIKQYLNRLSDYLWLLARVEEQRSLLREELPFGR